MTDKLEQPDRLEHLLAQTRELEDAGVFQRTPVDPAALLRDDSAERRPGRLHRLFVALQAAACLALVVGVVSLWSGGDNGDTLVDGRAAGNVAVADINAGALTGCMSGPVRGSMSGECRSLDSDDDGDVDLADFGAFQRGLTADR